MSSNVCHNHLLIVEDNTGRREFVLDAPFYSIGRDSKCDIRLVSQFVSRRHATLMQLPNEDGTYYYRIVDGTLKGKPSSNGLLIHGRKRSKHDLQDADEIVLGPGVRVIYYMVDQGDDSSTEDWKVTLIPEGDGG